MKHFKYRRLLSLLDQLLRAGRKPPEMAIADPARLYTLLLNTGLQSKDNALHQVIHDLIGAVVGVNKSINTSSVSSGSAGSTGPQGLQGISGVQGISGLDGIDGDDNSFSSIPINAAASIVGVLPINNGGTGTSGAFGVPLIKDVQSKIAQVADIADTNFVGGNVAGLYRVSYYLVDTTSDITAGAVTLNIKYTDIVGARTLSSTPVVLTATTAITQGTLFIQLASGNVTYGVTHTGIFGTATFALYLTFERLN